MDQQGDTAWWRVAADEYIYTWPRHFSIRTRRSRKEDCSVYCPAHGYYDDLIEVMIYFTLREWRVSCPVAYDWGYERGLLP